MGLGLRALRSLGFRVEGFEELLIYGFRAHGFGV